MHSHQAANSAYPLPISAAYWVIPGRLLAGEHPLLLDQHSLEHRMQRFVEANITAFVDLTDTDECTELGEYLHLLVSDQRFSTMPMIRRHIPIRDMDIPSLAQMHCILETIDHALAQKHTVYVHCWGGLGRTGTVVGCYLVHQGWSGAAALEEIKRLRQHTRDGRYPSPSTAQQRQFVLDWKRR